ncbi:MAG: sugar phosphate isomerase/epimerase family protein [Verrucomicrobiota bacterium]
MNRRTFMHLGSVMASAACLPFLGTAVYGAVSKKRMLKKAVNLSMIKVPGASVTDKFLLARDAGFDGIELNLPDEALDLDVLLKAKAASGLEVASIICTPQWKFPLSDPDPANRERTIRGLQFDLEIAGQLGCKRVLLVPGVVTEDVDYAQCWERAIVGIRRCLDAAEKAQCHIAVENVWNQFIMNPVDAVRFLDEINSPWVGWHFDVGNCVVNSWPEHWPHILGKRILNVHIKEFSRKKAKDEGLWKGFGAELGEGDVNWSKVMKALDEVGYQGYGIVEVPGGDAERLRFLSARMDQLFES